MALQIQYDKAVVAVGEQAATFGVKGVKENCFFMKGGSGRSPPTLPHGGALCRACPRCRSARSPYLLTRIVAVLYLLCPCPADAASPHPPEVSDAVELRKRIAQKFELASLPGTSDKDRWGARGSGSEEVVGHLLLRAKLGHGKN